MSEGPTVVLRKAQSLTFRRPTRPRNKLSIVDSINISSAPTGLGETSMNNRFRPFLARREFHRLPTMTGRQGFKYSQARSDVNRPI